MAAWEVLGNIEKYWEVLGNRAAPGKQQSVWRLVPPASNGQRGDWCRRGKQWAAWRLVPPLPHTRAVRLMAARLR